MKYACRYAIVRFMPYRETGEFANVGIVLMCPKAKFFGFQMLGKGIARITSFFDQLDPMVFRSAKESFTKELHRIQKMVEHAFAGFDLHATEPSYLNHIFDEMARPREAIMFLAEPRGLMTENPAAKLKELFEHYIGRGFIRHHTHEEVVERRVQHILKAADLTAQYHKMVIGNDNYRARFPFVRVDPEQRPLRIIKPLNLAHDDATKLFDHGWEWVGRVKKLRSYQQLPADVLFAAERPEEHFGPRATAYAEVKAELEHYGVLVASAGEEERIVEFARAH